MRINHFLIVLIFSFFATMGTSCSDDKQYDPYKRKVLEQHSKSGSLGAALSPEGYYAIVGGTKSKYPVVWDLMQQKVLHELKDPLTEDLYIYKFSRDSKYVAVVGENKASIWDVESGKKYGGYVIGDQITAVDVNSDGVYMVLGTLEGAMFYIHSATGKVIRQFLNRRKVEHVALTPNNLFLVSADSDNQVKVWRMANSKVSVKIPIDKPISQMYVSNQGIFVATSQGGMYMYSIVTGKLLYELDYPNTSVSAGLITSSNQYLVTANMPNKINVWNVRTGELIQTLNVKSFSSATTGQRYVLAVAYNSEDKEVYIEDASGYGEILPVTELMTPDEKANFNKKAFIRKKDMPEKGTKTKEEKLKPVHR